VRVSSGVNKARALKAKGQGQLIKAKAKHYQGHSPKAKAIPVGNEAGTVPSPTAMGDHCK